MPFKITKIESTPNPRARKLIVDPSPGSIRSFFKPEDARDDPMGKALFDIEGVTNVLIHTHFVSVSIKDPSAWTSTLPKLREALRSVPSP